MLSISRKCGLNQLRMDLADYSPKSEVTKRITQNFVFTTPAGKNIYSGNGLQDRSEFSCCFKVSLLDA
jgi:hypothetical protein